MSNLKPRKSIGILHYSAPPVIGGVEAVIKAHLELLIKAGYHTAIIAGRGEAAALPEKTEMINIPEIDTNHPKILQINKSLESGKVPAEYSEMESRLINILEPVLQNFDHLIIHNVFTKHFNLPLTSALHKLLDAGSINHTIPWCHDFTWTSPSSRSKVHPGFPWDLLRTKRADCDYVVVSQERQHTLAELFTCDLEEIQVIYNGVDPAKTLGLTKKGWALIQKLDLLNKALVLLMPVRITKAKNIEFALQVLAELKKDSPAVMLIITGPPDPHSETSMAYYQNLKDLRSELKLDPNMRFIFESGPDPELPFYISEEIVGDLYRISDVMFMPSHREGFGMPVIEAGLAGLPIVSREVPASNEIAREDAFLFNKNTSPSEVASGILEQLNSSPISHFRMIVRQEYTWESIFQKNILPILNKSDSIKE